MAYRYGTYNQIGLFSESIEEYISPDNPVHSNDVFMETLELESKEDFTYKYYYVCR